MILIRPTKAMSRRRPKRRGEKKGRREGERGERHRASVMGKEKRKSANSSRTRRSEAGRYEWKRE